MAELQINSEVINGISNLSLQGELDSYSAPRLRHLLEILTEAEHPMVVIELADLEYIDSIGLGVLVAGLKKAADRSGTLALAGPTPAIARVFRITGLDKVFLVFPDAARAQEHLHAGSA